MRYAYFSFNSTDNFVRYSLNGLHIVIANDDAAADEIDFSFKGSNVEGNLKAGESLQMQNLNANEIWIKSTTAGSPCPFRIFSFGETEIESITTSNDANTPTVWNVIRGKFKTVFDLP
jgi:hypothetical protein